MAQELHSHCVRSNDLCLTLNRFLTKTDRRHYQKLTPQNQDLQPENPARKIVFPDFFLATHQQPQVEPQVLTIMKPTCLPVFPVHWQSVG